MADANLPPDGGKEPAEPINQNPPSAAAQAKVAPKSGAPKPKKRRRWPWVIGALFVLLFLIVLLIPTLASMGWARSIVISQANQRINGRIDIKSWSLGWNSGIRVDGLVIYDATGRQILQLPHMSSGLTVLDLARGHYNLGKTEIDGLDVLVSKEADGSLNWAHLAKTDGSSNSPPTTGGHETKPPAEAAKPAGNSAQSAPPSKLPDVEGDVVVSNASITYEDRAGTDPQPPVYLRSIEAHVTIPNINAPITNSLTANAQVGTGANSSGSIVAGGTASVIQNNIVSLDTATVNETIDLKGLNLAMLPAVISSKAKPQMAGQSDGHFVIALDKGSNGSVLGQLSLRGVSLASGAGPSARQVLSDYNAAFDTNATFSKTGQHTGLKVTRLGFTDNQKIISIEKDATRDLIVMLPATAGEPSGGKLHLSADLKRLNDISQAFSVPPAEAQDPNRLQLQSGKLNGDLAVEQGTPDQVHLTSTLSATELTVGGPTAAPIKDETVNITLDALAQQDFSKLDVTKLDAAGSLLTAHVTDSHFKLSNGAGGAPVSPLAMVERLTAELDVPSLAKVQALMRSFSPAAPPARVAGIPGPPIAAAGKKLTAGAIPPAPATSQPVEIPPMDITGGSAKVTLAANGDGNKLTVTPAVTLADFTFKRGAVAYDAHTIDLKAEATILSATSGSQPNATILEQVQEIQLPQLHITAPGIGNADVSLPKPIDIKNPAALSAMFSSASSKPSSSAPGTMTGELLVHGSLGQAMTFMNALSGQPDTRKLDGGYALDESFGTDASGLITVSGRSDLNDLTSEGAADPEKAFRILNTVTLNSATKVLDIQNLSVQATTTNSLNLVVKGRIVDLGGRQQIDKELTADIGYELAPLWQVLFPLMTPEQQKSYKDVQVSGKEQSQFIVSGAYPSGKTFNEAVPALLAHGGLKVEHFAAKGLALDKADIPIDLKDGLAHVQYNGKPEGQNYPPGIACNNGTINLGGLTVDLRGEHTLLSSPTDLKLLDKISLNPVLAQWGLGDILNNPFFVGATEASGQVNFTIASCEELPVDSLGSAEGNAAFDLTIGSLQLGGPDWAKFLPSKVINSLKGEVPSYHITIDKGILTQDFTFALLEHKRPIQLKGQVNLANKQMLATNLELPWTLLGVKDKTLQQYLPEGVVLPFTGQTDNARPGLDVNQLVQKYLGEAGGKYLRDQLVKGSKNAGPPDTNPSTEPAESPQDQAIKALGDLLNRNKKKKQPQPGQ